MTVHPEDQDGPTGGAGALGGLGGADLSSLMAQAQQMQQQLMAAQEELAQGLGGGGLGLPGL